MQNDGDASDFNESRAEVFEAISHPVRIKILQALNEKPMGFAELGRAVGIEGGGHLGFHLRKLSNLVRMTPEGVYALTGNGKEALWTVNALRKSSNGSSKASVVSAKQRNWTRAVLGGLLITLIAFGGVAVYQQERLSLLDGQITSQNSQISRLQSQIVSLGGDSPSFYSGMNASLVIGKPNFKTAENPLTSHSLYNPVDVALDSPGDLWIADANRILEFNPPFTNWLSASLVLGQLDFTGLPNGNSSSAPAPNILSGPTSIAFAPSGNLWVVDRSNQRVVEFKGPFSNGMDASLVIGQPNFVTNGCHPAPCHQTSTKADDFADPTAVAFDPLGDLWVADMSYGRVLEFTPPFTNDMNASLVIGQTGFTTPGGCGVGGFYPVVCGRSTLAGPNAITFDSVGNLWVSDLRSDRVLEFTAPFSNGMNASLVIGQPIMGFTGRIPSGPSPHQNTLSLGWGGLHFDSSGNLWVSDSGNRRVLEFRQPFSNSMGASLVIGQSNFTALAGGLWAGPVSQSGFSSPAGITFDHAGNLWVVDSSNNRALRFGAPFSNGMDASLVIGQLDFTTNQQPVTPSQLSPSGIALDHAGDLWIADGSDNRVLEFRPPFANGMYASLVLGQPDFASSASGTFHNGLNHPSGLAFDSSGDLWVGWTGGISEFKPPFSSGMGASLVIGNGSRGGDMAFDLSGNLWVVGTTHSGVSGILVFKAPFSSGMNFSSIMKDVACAWQSDLLCTVHLALAFDSLGDLWVSEQCCTSDAFGGPPSGNAILVEFKTPLPNDINAAQTIRPDPAGLNYSAAFTGMSFDSSGNLFVADGGNFRILEFKTPISNATSPKVVIGQGPPEIHQWTVTPTGFSIPGEIIFDSKGNLWVADAGNARVLRFDPVGPALTSRINGDSPGLTSATPQAFLPAIYLAVVVVAATSSLVTYRFLKRKMSVPAS